MKKKLLRALAVPMFAVTLVLAAFSGPVHAETDTQLAAEWQEAWDTHKFYETTPPAPGSGRSRVTTSISVDIDAPAAHVFPAYSNFENHIGRAAFLKRVVTHKDWFQTATRYINLTAIEEIPYQGAIVVSKVHAQQRRHPIELYYETDSWSEPGVVTHQKIVFKRLAGGKTRVTEQLTFEADDALIDFVITNGVASHQQTQTALKEAIESGAL